MLVLTAATLFTPLERMEHPLLLVEDGRIVEIMRRGSREVPSRARVVDFGDGVLAPAFVDIHIHGSAGHDVMKPAPEAMPAIEQFLAQHGVGSYFPTTVSARVDVLLAALDRLASSIEAANDGASGDGLRARPLGIHLEGPFISHARRGVHPREDLQRPTVALFERFWQASRGHIKLMTIAPELDDAMEVIAEAVRRGVCVSLGHSDADFVITRNAVTAGARHATHTFNAMRPLHHRDPGILAEVLTDKRLSADIIADGIHVDPAIVNLLVQAKGADGTVLITDATAAAGMPDGRYRLGSFEIEIRDGRCLADGKLAGSALTMDHAVRNVMRFAGAHLREALQMATLNPARVVGLANNKGTLAPGADADIAVLGPAGEFRKTIIGGRGV